jgi:mono/diheme cytochrome c family protein
VHYVLTTLIQTEPRPVINFLRAQPTIYLSQTMPESASFERGRKTYLTTCADCHGLSGQGDGWNGQYLGAKPADLTAPSMRDRSMGELFATVSLGVLNTSDPVWEEWLPEEQRWDVIQYMTGAFVSGQRSTSSVYGDGATAANFLTLSKQNWLDEGHTISVTNGADLYATYCTGCHGDKGQGGVEGLASHPSGGPAPFPPDLPEAYILWRVWEGVPDSMMYPFQWLLSEADIWDVTAYVESVNSTGGGQP